MTDAQPMLPLVQDSDDPMLREEFARLKAGRGFVLNLHRMMAHAPMFMKASGEMAMTLRHKGALPRSLVELVILRAAQVVNCDYVWERHLSLARDGGVTDQQIAEVAQWPDSKAFTPAQKTALGFAEKVARGGLVDGATFAALRREYSPREIVELTMQIGFYVSTATFIKTLAIPDDNA
jgi:4-carboxymuconolactone decarboxylase